MPKLQDVSKPANPKTYCDPHDLGDMTLLRVNPDIAIQLNEKSPFFGWIYVRGEKGYIEVKKANPIELYSAISQAADGVVYQLEDDMWMNQFYKSGIPFPLK